MNKALIWWYSLDPKQRRVYCYKEFSNLKIPSKLHKTEIQKIYLNHGK